MLKKTKKVSEPVVTPVVTTTKIVSNRVEKLDNNFSLAEVNQVVEKLNEVIEVINKWE